jgi:N-acetyl-1-D-myo-inositol-2-amino-2-deoxy-alpha-D-glucopyranoside deacetylase
MAMYADLGAQVTLVTCTRGEEGEVLISDLSHLASSATDSLGLHREVELKDAMAALGVNDFRFLGNHTVKFRDSGMMGTEPNNRPDVFWQADLDVAAAHLVKVIEEVKPHVLITYDEIGGYGHPDHIQAHRVAMRASELAKWKISKIYWNAMPKSVLAEGIAKMKEIGSDFFGAESVDDLPFAKDDSLVTAMIDGTKYVDLKMKAMAAHATQIELDGPFFALSNREKKLSHLTQMVVKQICLLGLPPNETDLFCSTRSLNWHSSCSAAHVLSANWIDVIYFGISCNNLGDWSTLWSKKI